MSSVYFELFNRLFSMSLKEWLTLLIFAVIAYLLGSISPATIIGRLYGVDIKKVGSGNAGTTNVMRVLGWRAALVTLVIDIMKGFIAVRLALNSCNLQGAAICAICVVLGHIFPIFTKFKGGKGVATTFGAIWVINWPSAFAALIIAALGAGISRKMSIGSIVACIAYPFLILYYQPRFLPFAIILALMVLIAHTPNIKRLAHHEEPSVKLAKNSTGGTTVNFSAGNDDLKTEGVNQSAGPAPQKTEKKNVIAAGNIVAGPGKVIEVPTESEESSDSGNSDDNSSDDESEGDTRAEGDSADKEDVSEENNITAGEGGNAENVSSEADTEEAASEDLSETDTEDQDNTESDEDSPAYEDSVSGDENKDGGESGSGQPDADSEAASAVVPSHVPAGIPMGGTSATGSNESVDNPVDYYAENAVPKLRARDKKKVAFIGNGSFGTALANVVAHNGHDVMIYGRNKDAINDMRESGQNKKYLPGVKLSDDLRYTYHLMTAANKRDFVVFAVPAQQFRSVAKKAAHKLDSSTIVVNIAKGIEQKTLKRMSEVAGEELPDNPYVVLSGPSHAEEISRNYPATVVAASKDPDAAKAVQNLFMGPKFRVYTSEDVTGVELGGALKNVIAIGTGISDGMEYGDNTKAALMTRGIHEISKLGVALGADENTFSGLSGIGDLMVTCSSNLSRNRRCGLLIGQGMRPDDAVKEIGSTVEGFYTVDAAVKLAKEKNVEMPITEAVEKIIKGEISPEEAMHTLMGRSKKAEVSASEDIKKSSDNASDTAAPENDKEEDE